MTKPVAITRAIVIAAGVVQLILGGLLWAGIGKNLVPVHATIGTILVLSLWTCAFFAARAGAPRGLVALAVVWGLIVPVVGVTQTSILPGSTHWIIQVVHVLLGLAAMGLAGALGSRIGPHDRTRAAWDVRDPAQS
jgi:hypothetical protein